VFNFNYYNSQAYPHNHNSVKTTTKSTISTLTTNFMPIIEINNAPTDSSVTDETTTYQSTDETTTADFISNKSSTNQILSSFEMIYTTPTLPALQYLKPNDLTKIPNCVRNAVCRKTKPREVGTNTNGTTTYHVVSINEDPRLGICECLPGFVNSETGSCDRSAAASFYSKELILRTDIIIIITISIF